MKRIWWTVILIVAVVVFAVLIINQGNIGVSASVAKCIGMNSVLYIQYGCHACGIQEDLFGDSYEYLNVVDCFYDKDACLAEEIKATPTWIIDGVKYEGVRQISDLQVFTGCG